MSIGKPCIKCGATDRNANGDCSPCARERSARYRASHPEAGAKASAKWRAENPEANAKYREENREKVNARMAKYYIENHEKLKVVYTKWRLEHPEYVAKWRADNSEKLKASCAAWGKANPEKRKASKHKRRARKITAGDSFTADDIRTMLKSQKGKCVTCGANIKKAYHIDHVMPLMLGGSNGIRNIQLLCPHCNLSKSAKHPINFMQEMGYLL